MVDTKDNHGAALSPMQAYALLGPGVISRGGFYAAIARGEIPHKRLGKRIIIPRHKFLAWLDATEEREPQALQSQEGR